VPNPQTQVFVSSSVQTRFCQAVTQGDPKPTLK